MNRAVFEIMGSWGLETEDTEKKGKGDTKELCYGFGKSKPFMLQH